MDIESTKVTPEEIAQFRAELAEDSNALGDIDVIERCDGDLKYAAMRLARRSNIDTVRADENNFGSSVIVMQWTGVIRDGTLI